VSKSIQEPRDLIGERVSAVCFVWDYVEIRFDGTILRSLSNPIVRVRGELFRYPDSGSRDALCQLVGATVRGLTIDEGRALELSTDNDCNLTIPLASADGDETMHFLPGPNQPLSVW
jgi:hypothetical protein